VEGRLFMKKFYDTNGLLNIYDELDKEDYFYTSSLVLHELEHIKTSRNKDEDIKFKARKVTHFLQENPDKYECIIVQEKHYELLRELNLDVTNDNLIIACAKEIEDVVFITNDICCWNISKKIFKLNTDIVKRIEDNDYKGYKSIIMTEEEMAKFYETEKKENKYGLLKNEYLIIKDTLNQPLDAWRFNGEELIQLDVKSTKSNLLGKLKAKDFYQQCVLDSFYNNQITVVKGKAGSGKSHLAMNFLFSQLEKDKIDKIIIFTNPVPTRNSAEIGFLPGSREEKLMESNIGNFLLGKMGDKMQAFQLMSMGKLLILPISDIRGFDTTNMNAGIYITEAQNMSIDMMKLSLQRIGDDCITIIDGDCDTQVDKRETCVPPRPGL
jgi:predicted ribonuclease YlaK